MPYTTLFRSGKPADRIAIEADVDQTLSRCPAQILVHRTLLDAEQGRDGGMLRAGVESLARTLGPAHRTLHREGRPVPRGGKGGAFVERHDDVGVQQQLYYHRQPGRPLERGTVEGAFAAPERERVGE